MVWINPPPFGQVGNYSGIPEFQLGSTVTLQWENAAADAILWLLQDGAEYLCEPLNLARTFCFPVLPAFGGVATSNYAWTVSYYNSSYPADTVYYLQLRDSNENNADTSHYFNIVSQLPSTSTSSTTSSSQTSSQTSSASSSVTSSLTTSTSPTTVSIGSGPTSTSDTSPTAAASATAAAASGLSSSAKVGIGIGVGIGIPLVVGIFVIIFILLYRRRADDRKGRPTTPPRYSDITPSMADHRGMYPPTNLYNKPYPVPPQELSGQNSAYGYAVSNGYTNPHDSRSPLNQSHSDRQEMGPTSPRGP